MAETKHRSVVFLEYGGCKLIKTKSPFKGFYTWDMVSPKTGTNSVFEKSFNKRVRTHWNGFIDNQNK